MATKDPTDRNSNGLPSNSRGFLLKRSKQLEYYGRDCKGLVYHLQAKKGAMAADVCQLFGVGPEKTETLHEGRSEKRSCDTEHEKRQCQEELVQRKVRLLIGLPYHGHIRKATYLKYDVHQSKHLRIDFLVHPRVKSPASTKLKM